MSGVIVGRGDFGQGWLWPGVIVAGVILGRGDFGQGWSRFRGDSGGVILAGWFCQGWLWFYSWNCIFKLLFNRLATFPDTFANLAVRLVMLLLIYKYLPFVFIYIYNYNYFPSLIFRQYTADFYIPNLNSKLILNFIS